MSRSMLIRNGLVILPEGERVCDLALRDGRIEGIGEASLPSGTFDEVLDAQGLAVLPGAIDAHVHFRIPGGAHKEDWGTASRAALAGGVTMVLDMPNTSSPTISRAALEEKRRLVAPEARVNYGFFMGATADNLDEAQQAENIAGLKVYMGSSTGGLLVCEDAPLERIFGRFRGLIAVHAEDERIIRENSLKFAAESSPQVHGRIRTIQSARRATERAIGLARRHGARLHICHMSTAEELALVRAAEGVDLSSEVTPHHLVLTEEALSSLGTLAKMNPPLRFKEDTEALWSGLSEGAITCVATDHAPHTLKEKAGSYWEAPSGVPGVQHMLPILLDAVHWGRLSLSRVAQVTAEWPARRFGIHGKGRIAPGYDADLVLVGMGVAHAVSLKEVQSRCGWTPYEGMTFYGWPQVTLLGGTVVYDRGNFPAAVRGREVRFSGS